MKLVGLIFLILALGACASQPEVPSEYQKATAALSQEAPARSGQQNRLNAHYQRYLAQVEIRPIETDCQVYSKPNLYSERIETAKAGRDVWTQETGSEWYKVYRGNKYGYMNKICFQN
jgi:hypothetical protein